MVGASDYLPSTIWSKKFLESQGNDIPTKMFGQDNVSEIRLEKMEVRLLENSHDI
jgi:hypothetical protein